MDARNTNFRIILALTSFPQDIGLTGTSLKVTVGTSTKTIPLTTKEATPLDFSGVQPGAKVEFGLEDSEGFMFGYSELRVPNIAFEKNETEVNEHLRFYLIDKEKDSFVANVYAIFLNKGMFKDRSKEKSPISKGGRSPLRTGNDRKSSRSPTGSAERRSPQKIRNQALNQEQKTEKNFQAYLNRLVDSHSSQLKNLVDEHNSVNEYIFLNKQAHNLPKNFADESLEVYSPSRLEDVSQIKSQYNSRIMNNSYSVDPQSAKNKFQVAQFGNESRVESSMLRDLSPIGGERGRTAPTGQDNSPAKRQASSSPVQSPLKKSLLERKVSTDSQPGASPLRKKFADASFDNTLAGRKEIPDAQYYKAQITSLNNQIINQNTKLTDFEIYRNENEELRQVAQKSNDARKALQESIIETTNELKATSREAEKQLANSINEREGLIKKNGELQNSVTELTNNFAAAKTSLQDRDDTIMQQMLKLNELDDLRSRQKKSQDALAAMDKQRTADQESYKQALISIDQSLQETRRIVEGLNADKKKLVVELNKVNEELNIERANHQATQNELVLTKKRIENAEAYKAVVASLEVQRDQLSQQLKDAREAVLQTQALLAETQDKTAARIAETANKEKAFQRELANLREKLSASEAKNEKLNKEVAEQKLKNIQQTTTISSLEQLVCVKEDAARQLEQTEKQLAQLIEDRKVLRSQLETLASNQEQTNSKLLEVERQSNSLRTVIDEKEEQIQNLVYALQNAGGSTEDELYVPAKGDFIDGCVADFINGTDEISRLKLLFIREQEGVYQFGSKRVYVKVEAGRVLIRVGGGFLTIEEFVDQYSPLEMDKIVRNDPMKKLSRNIAVNKTLIGKCVNQMDKAKTNAYEYRTDNTGARVLNASPTNKSRLDY